MFEYDRYFAALRELLAEPVVLSLVEPKPNPRIEFDEHRSWSIIFWRVEATLSYGTRLAALECHSQENHKHYRNIKYRLMKADGTLIFQVDSHGREIPFEMAPHLHKGPNENVRLQDGDWELDGLSLSGFDFCTMWQIVRDYLQDGRLPWRT